jgi:5-methylthioadenosine/S-adenosylhomocysteine deaminase
MKSYLALAALLTLGLPAFAAPPPPERVDLVVRWARVLTVDAEFRVLDDGAVAVRGTKIVAVAPSAEIAKRFRAKRTVDAKGAILMPGLVNGHNHAAMSLLRSGADDRALMDWLTGFIFPAEGKNVSPEFVRVGTLLSCLEMIRSGTTTFADMYYFEEEVAKAVDEAGMRGVLGETVIGFPVPDAATPDKALEYARSFIAKWKGNPRIVPAIAPHAPYTVDPDTFRKIVALSNETGAPILTHVAETKDEEKQIAEKYGKRPTEYLDSLGVLGPRTVAAHCVFLNEADIATFVRSGAGCVHNPESNMKLASGAAPMREMLAANMKLGLGTDGPASNNDLDMFGTMDFAGKLAKLGSGDPRTLPARTTIELATRRGAEVLGLADRIGSLEAGKEADMILVATDTPKGTPMWDPASQVVSVFDGDDVRAVWVAGRLLYDSGRFRTLDERAIRRRAEALRTKIQASLVPKEISK